MPEPFRLRPAVFLDRDGALCEEVGYVNHISRFRMFPFVAAALRSVVVTSHLIQAMDWTRRQLR